MNHNRVIRYTRLLAGVAMALLASQGWAQYQYVSKFGSFGSSPGNFNDPRGVGIRNGSQIVVAESGNDRIQLCSDTGSCTTFGSFGVLTGQFDRPRGVAITASGQIVIADRGNDRIQICSSSGSCDDFGRTGSFLGQFESPRDVAVNAQGQIIVADTENNRIQVCSEQGSCTAFGSLGSTLGQFNSPSGVAVNSQGQIIVADRMNNRVQICSTQGACTAFGSSGSGLGQFSELADVAVDNQDRIIAVDRFNHRVQVCTAQGSCTAFGSFGSGNGQFNAPWGAAVDAQNRIVVSDLGNNRIQIFAEPAAPPPNDFQINAGLNDAWFNPATPGQGFFITVFPDIQRIFVAWFTYDTARPGAGVPATIGEPGHRWLTAFGPYNGDTAVLDIELTQGGTFNSPSPAPSQGPYGSLTIEFSGCNEALVSYNIPAANRQGQMAIERIALDNLPLCEQAAVNTIQSAPPGENTIQNHFAINPGLNDAWFNPLTPGQGFFFTVFPTIQRMFVAWFTFDTERPGAGVQANLGEPGHRWLTAFGPYSGHTAMLDIELTQGGVFNSANPAPTQGPDGSLMIEFAGCNSALASYDIASANLQGEIPLERIVLDNVPACQGAQVQ